jgi:2-C-methyl-D-erythritol 2,4-cyclodiphosphate synthase
MNSSIGIGYDIHRLVKGRKLFLGGVLIPYSKGLLGHSDADCLIHAIIDALLGAASLGDIGEHFPDTDPKYKNIRSIELLKNTAILLKRKKIVIGNIDAVIIAQEPKLLAFKKSMRSTICFCLGIKEEKLNIKAKTNEALGAVGKKQAIACWASAIVTRGG